MLATLLSIPADVGSFLQTFLYVNIGQPLLFSMGLMTYDDTLYDSLFWVVVGGFEVLAILCILRPLEALWPAEKWQDRKATRVDALYTCIIKFGLLNLVFFFACQPFVDQLQEWLRLKGVSNFNLDSLWPAGGAQPVVAFLIYLVVLDFAGYWYHRWQHRFGVWWEFHALHHSQQQMSAWTDDRNHLLDDIVQALFFALIALAIGVPPSQFAALIVVSNLIQNVQHMNIRTGFGWLGRVIVSPLFHRRHHAVGYGHEGTRYGCNFGVLFPWWDMMFGSASWNPAVEPTGIRDQKPQGGHQGVDYGKGFWAQQWRSFSRAAHRLTRQQQ